MKTALGLLALTAFGITTGCSSGPPEIKPGSPAFFWAVARESYRTGDLVKTDATLIDLGQTDSEFAAPARTWQAVVSAGMTQGYTAMAEAYEAGSHANPANALPFRKQASNLRSLAATTALEFAQATYNMAQSDQNAQVLLAFGFPPGSAAPPEALAKLANGTWLTDADRDSLLTAMLQRGVVRAVSEAVGTPGDPGKAQAAFQTAEVRIPRETFLFGMAKLMYQEADLFSPMGMDRQDRFILMCRTAVETLRTIPQNKDTEALESEIQATLKQFAGI
ncbi:MAG TPA: hypothetical protein VLY24_13215 [Bryobacteraceae bacterium]|nr:hypothetical protein [Bryobacteraceae bacterium]